MILNLKCFNCSKKLKGELDTYTVTINNVEEKHKVKMCSNCAMQLDDILKNIEDIHNEGSEPI